MFVRPALCLDPVDTRLATLRSLEEDGVIDALLIRAWPEVLPLSAQSVYGEFLDAYERFADWADGHGLSIHPPFVVRTTTSTFTGETKTLLRTPVMCLAVYRDETLVGVYPHSTGESHRNVAEAISLLETGEFAGRPRCSSPATADTDACPECGGSLVNVQGIVVCHD
nr:HTH domain-containing protein [Halegenticoccus soli]